MKTPDTYELTHSIHIKNEEFCAKKYPEFTESLRSKYIDKYHIERLYLYVHPNCNPTCSVCGKPTAFINFNKGYRLFCSPGCASKSDIVKDKKADTCKSHYGVSNPSQSEEVVQKKCETMLEQYGVTNTSLLPENREKAKHTTISRYGVSNAMQLDSIKAKLKQTNNERYGVDWPMMSPEIIDKANTTYTEKYGGRGNASPELKQKSAQTCQDRYGDPNFNNREKAKHTLLDKYGELSFHQTPKDTSIEVFVRDILKEHNIEFIQNNRTLLDGKELDIYIPSHKLAFELNGYYWHDDIHKPKKYHQEKFKACEQQGIQLVSLWDDQIYRNSELVKSMVLSKLGIFTERLYARKCEIRDVSPSDSLKFLYDNHLQGGVNSSVRLGLYYNDELVSIMTFGKKRKSLNQQGQVGEWELYRYCNKLNTQVIGGASKLLRHFIKTYNPTTIESFSSNDISNGKLYESLSFTKTGESLSYWYIKNNRRYHRFNFTKKHLVELGYDSNKTERQIMRENKYCCIYDSGQTKWIRTI